MKRPGSGSGGSASLILAFVFPAMIAAAIALAYYGFRYTDSVSRPIEALFREYSREEAEKLIADLEARIDEVAVVLFRQIDAEKRMPALTSVCEIEGGPYVGGYAVLGPARNPECYGPPASANQRKTKATWDAFLKALNWDAVKLGSYHHYHELVDKSSVLLVFSARKVDEGEPYFVAAQFDVDLIVKTWLAELVARTRKNLLVTITDDENHRVAGSLFPTRGPGLADDRFQYEGSLGKALYRWRIRIAPQNAAVFQSEAERRKVFGPLLIVFSTVIIAVGLGTVWLAVAAERRASRLKSDFIANVSHELKTPLSLIRMFGEMVASGRHKGEDAAKEYGAIITRESERLSHLIDNVLDFARLERGKASYDFAEGDLPGLVERALDICRYRLEKDKVKLRTDIEPGLPPVRMDEDAITLMVLNLVDNALKYAADGGDVVVGLARIPGGVVLSVRDFGPGVLPEEQSRIFERFYRAQAARDQNVRGSGIGLSLVKYIAEAHGGRVTVESPVVRDARPGPGALFRVFLPAPVSDGTESDARHVVAAN